LTKHLLLAKNKGKKKVLKRFANRNHLLLLLEHGKRRIFFMEEFIRLFDLDIKIVFN